jgi:hypothetical protein
MVGFESRRLDDHSLAGGIGKAVLRAGRPSGSSLKSKASASPTAKGKLNVALPPLPKVASSELERTRSNSYF